MQSLLQSINEAMGRPATECKEFVIIKPGFLNEFNEVVKILNRHHIMPVREYRRCLSYEEAGRLYSPHKDEPFYKDLCKYMSGDDSIGMLCTNYGGALMDDVKKEIRDRLGRDEMHNCIHSSDRKRIATESRIYFAG